MPGREGCLGPGHGQTLRRPGTGLGRAGGGAEPWPSFALGGWGDCGHIWDPGSGPAAPTGGAQLCHQAPCEEAQDASTLRHFCLMQMSAFYSEMVCGDLAVGNQPRRLPPVQPGGPRSSRPDTTAVGP